MSVNEMINPDWVTPLSDAEKAAFDREGYLIIQNLLTADEISGIRRHLDDRIGAGVSEANAKMSKVVDEYMAFMQTFVDAGKLSPADLNKLKHGKNIFNHTDTTRLTSGELGEIARRGKLVGEAVMGAFKSGEAIEAAADYGAIRVSNMANVSSDLAVTYTHPRVLGAVQHFFGSTFRVNEVSSRTAAPETGQQPMHYDNSAASRITKKVRGIDKSDLVFAIWAIDDFEIENGATRLVPGSHKWREAPEEVLSGEKLFRPYDGEQRAVMPAGSVLLFQSYIWHSGMNNASDRPRRMIYNSFGERHVPPLQNMEEFLTDQRKQELTDVERYVFDL